MPKETLGNFIRARLGTWTIETICQSLDLRTIGEGHLVDESTIVETNKAGKVVRISAAGSVKSFEEPAPEPAPEPEPEIAEEILEDELEETTEEA